MDILQVNSNLARRWNTGETSCNRNVTFVLTSRHVVQSCGSILGGGSHVYTAPMQGGRCG